MTQVTYGIHPTFLPMLDLWNDFHGYYAVQLADLAKGFLPYRDFPYSFTPLFLYALYPFYAIGGVDAASIPIIVADAATAVVIYRIVGTWAKGKVPVLAGMAYVALPFALIYEGYLWLGSQPMTLFMVLSVYLASRNRHLGAAGSFGVATMFKQEALFMLPSFLIFLVARLGKHSWKAVAFLGGVIVAVSLPFLVLAPNQYIVEVSYGLIYLGTPVTYPAGQVSSLVSSGAPLTASSCSALTLTLLGTQVGCNYSYVTYPNPILTSFLLFLDGLSQWVLVPLLVLLGIALYASRKNTSFMEATSVYSVTILLTVFAYSVNLLLRYYLIPAYALLLASSRNIKGIIVGAFVSTVSLVTSFGTFQLVLVAFATLIILAMDQPVALEQKAS